jgi:serine/threonine protein kinase/Tol biopolymer transport system component
VTTPERWQRVEALYHAALQRPLGERTAFLRAACAGDEELRRDVESLLAQHASDLGFLNTPALAVAALAIEPSATRATLAVGQVLGAYTIVGLLGAGGMGEVYRASHGELEREVAIKLLPQAFVNDADRLARFEREKRLLAALNHPNIAAIYTVEPVGTGRALVLELVEGPTLAERLARGPLPIDEARRVATQIADALEAAHEKGIVHRDLKPANIKVRPDGTVKVLDFGLAKAVSSDGSSPDQTKSPTIALDGTGERVIGTPAYMSPEQARGQAVDKRTDIWAFGCVLFEMLTGHAAFAGATVTDTLAAIIEREPDWRALPVSTSSSLRRLLRRCLEKDPKRRLRDIGDAHLELLESADQSEVRPQASLRRELRVSAWVLIATALLVVAAGVASVWLELRGRSDTRVIRSSIIPPANLVNLPPQRLAISPDGSQLAFTSPDASGRTVLWVRALRAAAAQPLGGTDGAMAPFWSADSRTIGFFTLTDGKLKKIDASGGPVRTVTGSLPFGGSWNGDGEILFAQEFGRLSRLPANDDMARYVVTMNSEIGLGTPWFLPDGRHFLYNENGAAKDTSGVYVGSLDSAERSRVLDRPANAQYASGYLLFTRGSTLMAQPFDVSRLAITGEAVPLAEDVQTYGPTADLGAFSVSQNGILVFENVGRPEASQLVWYNRAGQQTTIVGEKLNSTWGSETTLSPDGSSAVVVVSEEGRAANDLWVFDTKQGLRSRLTFAPAREHMPVWSADGRAVAFARQKNGGFDVLRKAANGSGAEELLLSDGFQNFPETWSPDGRFLIYDVGNSAPPNRDLWVLPLEGDRKPFPLVQTSFDVMQSQFSPDGHWIAFASNESGRFEVYVTAFGDPQKGRGSQRSPKQITKWQVSTAGGSHPRWRRDGKELFFLAGDTLMAASVSAEADHFSVGRVERLFDARPIHPANNTNLPFTVYDVSADGKHFLINTVDESAGVAPLTLIANWPALLRK